jgi:hypothetical protein
MRKFIKFIIVVLISFIGIVALLEFLFRYSNNPVENKFSIYSELNDISIIIIGNSHSAAIGSPIVYDSLLSYNFSIGGQDIFHMYAILKAIKPKSTSLKKIVIGIDYDLLGYDYKIANQMWMDRLYYKYTNLLYDSSLSNRIMASSNFFLANRDLSNVHVFAIGKNETLETNYLNFLAKGVDCSRRAIEHSINKFDSSLIQKNLLYLYEINKIAKSKSIELLFVNYPKRDCYYNHYNEDVAIKGKMLISNFSDTTGINFIDLWRNKGFCDEDFLDSDHLSPEGVNKVLKIIFTK